MKPFDAPEESIGALDAASAAQLVAAFADIVLVVDEKGVIRDMAVGNDSLLRENCGAWVGQPWIDTVTIESRPKVKALLNPAGGRPVARWRHLNHTTSSGGELPLLYSAIRLEGSKRVVAVGRDLREISSLQQRLVDAQQALERDYWHLRQAETRYRHLFQTIPEAVLIVDAYSQKIVEANARAGTLFGSAPGDLIGRYASEAFSDTGVRAVQALMAGVRATGQADEVRAESARDGHALQVSVSMFRQESASFFMVRVTPDGPEALASGDARVSRDLLATVTERMPDAFVVTDAEGLIATANSAFLDLAQVATLEQLRGESLERWLGRSGVDLGVLVANLRQHGSVRLFATSVRGEEGLTSEVEISAVSVPNGREQCFGFSIRNVGRRLSQPSRVRIEGPRSVEQLAELVGRVPLKDLVQESTDMIEKLCIQAALELTRDNRASAAEMLGLSRQSLYVKLHRHGLGDLSSDDDKS